LFRIEVSVRAGFPDPRGDSLETDIRDIGITTVIQAGVSDVYLLEGELNGSEVERIGRELLADPVVEDFSWGEGLIPHIEGSDAHVVEVAYNPGVTDPVEESIGKAIRDLGIAAVKSIRTARKYSLWGDLSEETLQSSTASTRPSRAKSG